MTIAIVLVGYLFAFLAGGFCGERALRSHLLEIAERHSNELLRRIILESDRDLEN